MKPCPCGKIPEKLYLFEGQCSKWANAAGTCCGEWSVEFRTGYYPLDSEECMQFALEAWDGAPRQAQPVDLSKVLRKLEMFKETRNESYVDKAIDLLIEQENDPEESADQKCPRCGADMIQTSGYMCSKACGFNR